MSADPTAPQMPAQPNNVVRDPYGSGATFSWTSPSGETRIPQAGDPDFMAYNRAYEGWLIQRQQAYMQSPRYQADQARDNPDIASGRVPAVGYVAEAPNAWGVPVGARVTELTPSGGGGYQVAYAELGTPQQVKIEGPGYGFEGTVYAKDSQTAARIALAGYKQQYMGVDVSPSRIGGFVASSGGDRAVVQAGDPMRNEYWVKAGLPQYAGYSAPALSAEQQAEGFYIKEIKASGLTPQVEVANRNWESFWQAQGRPELSSYEAPKLTGNQYIYNPTVNEQGQLSFGIGNTDWEQQWKQLGVTDIESVRGYSPPTDLMQGSYVTGIKQAPEGLSYQIGNRQWESQWQALGVTDVNLVRGYQAPEGLAEGSYIKDLSQTNEGLSYTVGNRIQEERLTDINTRLETINKQNKVFIDAFNTGTIKNPADLQKALSRQNELTMGVFNEAESFGLISPTEKQAGIAQLNFNTENINTLVNNYKPSQQVAPTKVYSASNPNISPLGIDPSSDIARVAKTDVGESLLVRSDYKVASQQLVDVNGFRQISYVLEPKNQPVQTAKGIGNDVFSGSNLNFFGVQPIVNTNEKRELALNVVTAVIAAPVVAAASGAKTITQGALAVGKNALLGYGVSQGINTAIGLAEGKEFTQTLLSPQQAIEAGAQGVILTGAASTVNRILNISGRGLAPALERIAVFGGLGVAGGGVTEFMQTGQVTPAGLALGGVQGLAFGAAGEGIGAINTRYRITNNFREYFSNRGTNVFQPINQGPVKDVTVRMGNQASVMQTPITEINVGKILPETPNINYKPTSAKQGEFITNINGELPLTGKGPNYLVKQPVLKNLTISDQINIRSPNTFNPDVANAKINSMINQVPTKGGYDNYQAIMAQGRVKVANKSSLSDEQLYSIEEITSRPLPREVTARNLEQVNAKIKSQNFDVDATNLKIEAQVKEAKAFDEQRVNAGIEKALQEAAIEQATNKQFVTGVPEQVTPTISKPPSYLVTQPVLTNLTISEQINIRNPNTFDPEEADSKTDSMIKEIPTMGNYGDYRYTLSQGKTLTLVQPIDAQLSNLETLTDQPLPRSINNIQGPVLPNSAIAPLTNFSGITPLSSNPLAVGSKTQESMIAQINYNKVQESVSQRLSNQLLGTDVFTMNLINSRLMPASTSEANIKISNQVAGINQSPMLSEALLSSQNLKINVAQNQLPAQAIGLTQGVSQSINVQQGQLTASSIDLLQDIKPFISTKQLQRITMDVNLDNSQSNNRRKRSKGLGDIFTFTAFRTTSAPKQTGVEKQVVKAKLVNFYPSTNKKIPESVKSQKGPNRYYRAVTINGVSGIGEFQGTRQTLQFYPTEQTGTGVQNNSDFGFGNAKPFGFEGRRGRRK